MDARAAEGGGGLAAARESQRRIVRHNEYCRRELRAKQPVISVISYHRCPLFDDTRAVQF